jgi:hypothetical protein
VVVVPLRRNEHYEQGNGMGKDQKYPLSTCTNADARGSPWLSKGFMSLPGVCAGPGALPRQNMRRPDPAHGRKAL